MPVSSARLRQWCWAGVRGTTDGGVRWVATPPPPRARPLDTATLDTRIQYRYRLHRAWYSFILSLIQYRYSLIKSLIQYRYSFIECLIQTQQFYTLSSTKPRLYRELETMLRIQCTVFLLSAEETECGNIVLCPHCPHLSLFSHLLLWRCIYYPAWSYHIDNIQYVGDNKANIKLLCFH